MNNRVPWCCAHLSRTASCISKMVKFDHEQVTWYCASWSRHAAHYSRSNHSVDDAVAMPIVQCVCCSFDSKWRDNNKRRHILFKDKSFLYVFGLDVRCRVIAHPTTFPLPLALLRILLLTFIVSLLLSDRCGRCIRQFHMPSYRRSILSLSLSLSCSLPSSRDRQSTIVKWKYACVVCWFLPGLVKRVICARCPFGVRLRQNGNTCNNNNTHAAVHTKMLLLTVNLFHISFFFASCRLDFRIIIVPRTIYRNLHGTK